MKNHSRIIYFGIKISVIIYLLSINFALCTESSKTKSTENTRQVIEEENLNKFGSTSKKRDSVLISSSEVELIEDIPTPESLNESVNISEKPKSRSKREDLKVLFHEQQEAIAKLKDLLNKSRNENKWKDIFDFLTVRSSYIEFISLTTDIYGAMNKTFKASLDSYNINLQKTLLDIENILKIQTILIEGHAKRRLSLSAIACLNESYLKTMKFYEEKYEAFRLKLKKRDEIARLNLRLKNSFDSALVFMNNVLMKIKKDNYVLTRRKLMAVFNLFDKNFPGSIYRVYKLNNSMIKKALKDLSIIKNSAAEFVQSSNMILTNN